jgi:hypothetical protein
MQHKTMFHAGLLVFMILWFLPSAAHPVLTEVVRLTGKPVVMTFTRLHDDESFIRIQNGNPGLRHLEITVNGIKFKVKNLMDGEERFLSVDSAIVQGDNNLFTLKAYGQPGGQATILIWDGR